jgi:ABC-type branched-subunit amino acid transport system ATPase component
MSRFAVLVQGTFERLPAACDLLGVDVVIRVDTASATVLDVADRGYIVDQGEIVYEGTTADLAEDERLQQEGLGVGQSIDR